MHTDDRRSSQHLPIRGAREGTAPKLNMTSSPAMLRMRSPYQADGPTHAGRWLSRPLLMLVNVLSAGKRGLQPIQYAV